MTPKRTLTRDDLITMDEFAASRADRRRAMLPVKKLRRIALGPDATLYFESYETMWQQVHEMLLVEKGGEAQIPDELAAYGPLVPRGGELVATLMFEIDNEERRSRVLGSLGGVEEQVYIQVGDAKAHARPERDVERTTPEGKTSSVHFLHFDLDAAMQENFMRLDGEVIVGCAHPAYAHMAALSDASRRELSGDL